MILAFSIMGNVFLIVYAVVATWYLYKFSGTILAFEDAVDNALNELDTCFIKVQSNKHAALFEDPRIYNALNVVKDVKKLIVNVSQTLSDPFNNNETKGKDVTSR